MTWMLPTDGLGCGSDHEMNQLQMVLSPNPTSHYQVGVTSSFPDKYETNCSRQVLSLISHEEPQRHSPVSHETARNCVSSANKHASKY